MSLFLESATGPWGALEKQGSIGFLEQAALEDVEPSGHGVDCFPKTIRSIGEHPLFP
ncbi:hypothetical protein SAMN04488694_12620 [Natrinema hispanicum]|uniref:Uncharacterized protein n=1 Tax=Natrinema hispanicum TaxID=392421 RepID=A0A1I0IUC1_9EURY|nr:hypothetical protein SAMN04488694_12620 [Natrinema hispanicum]